MLLLIPVLLPVISGTILLIKTWKKKPWRRPRFILISALINSAVVLGFLIAQYTGTVNVTIAGSVAFWLEPDGLGSVLAGCMAVLMPAVLCYFLDFQEKKESLQENEMTDHSVSRSEARIGKPENNKNITNHGKRDIMSALLNYLFAAMTGMAFAKNTATMLFFFILWLLIVAMMVRSNGNQEKWYHIFSVISAVAVIFVLIVATFGGDGAVFYFDGYLTGNISDQILLVLYVLTFLGCSVRVLTYPFIADRTGKDDLQYNKGKVNDKRKEEERQNRESLMMAEELFLDTMLVFLLIRLTFSVFGISLLRGTWAQVTVTLIAVAGILICSVAAFREKTLQKKLSYIYGASFSMILTGIAVMTSHGYVAAVWMMVGFPAVQMLLIFFREAVRRKEISGEEQMVGLGRQMPLTFGCYVVACLGLSAVPPLVGFLSVWKLAKAFTRQGGLNYLSMAAVFFFLFLAALSLYPTVIRAFFPKNEPVTAEKVDEAGSQMLVPMVVLAAAVIAVGFFSGPLGEYIYQIGLGLS